jgi:hypothetical protein
MIGHLTRSLAVAGLLAGAASVARADGRHAPDVDIKLATRYCEAAGAAGDAGLLRQCMREFGYDVFRFGAGTRF